MPTSPRTHPVPAAEREGPDVSVVIPAHGEASALPLLLDRVAFVLERERLRFEVIVVDDGSADGSAAILRRRHGEDPRLRARILSKRHGKSAALDTGLRAARGRFVVVMDADLQDLPEEIPGLLRALDDGGFDLVQGWRQDRADPRGKVVASRVFNALCARFSGLPLHDVNCGFKAMRRHVLPSLRLGDDMHRFIPVLVQRRGFRVGEVPVRHARRAFGHSKYGPRRYARGLLDLALAVALPRGAAALSGLPDPLGRAAAVLAESLEARAHRSKAVEVAEALG
jgi:glycosyltransferase involved in cell wall biosynthesis